MNQDPFGDYQDKPPIPSPQGELQPTQTSSRGIAAYVPIIAIGIGVFAALWAISFVVKILYIGLAIIPIYVVSAIFITEKLKALGAKLDYTIRSREDLRQIGEIIDMNMKLAFILLVVFFPVMVVAVLKGSLVCTLLIMVVSFSLTPYTMSAEKKIKAMKVDAFDTEIESEFATMLAHWKEPGFGLQR